MKVGDLVRVVKNDMSLVIKTAGPKDGNFFNQIGTIVKVYEPKQWQVILSWYGVLFPSGYYNARRDALEVVSCV